MGLLDRGFSSFARVGSLRKISKSVLPYVLHYSRLTAANRCDASSGQSQADRDAETYDALALKELNGMLSSASVHDRLSIETAIAELKAEQSAARARRLKRMRVVGKSVFTYETVFDHCLMWCSSQVLLALPPNSVFWMEIDSPS